MASTIESPSSTSSYFHIDLPWPISYIPAICKIISLIYIAPPILLFTFDVGGYLLFKLFLKPFGNYPMHSYFKQAPREECSDGPSSMPQDSPSNSSSASGSPAIPSGALPATPTGLRQRHFKTHNRTKEEIPVEKVGFEGPMIDFKSPTASDYGDEATQNDEIDPGDSSETTSN